MRKISLIVIHCSATRVDRDFTAKDVDTAHRFRGFSCWGYHYYIRKSGQIEPMRDEDTVGAHARGFNAISLGVCYEGGLDENGKAADTRTSRQKEADASSGKRVVAALSGCKGGRSPGLEP